LSLKVAIIFDLFEVSMHNALQSLVIGVVNSTTALMIVTRVFCSENSQLVTVIRVVHNNNKEDLFDLKAFC